MLITGCYPFLSLSGYDRLLRLSMGNKKMPLHTRSSRFGNSLPALLIFWLVLSFSFFWLTLGTSYAASPKNQCGNSPIRFGDISWESGAFSTALLKTIIEKGYGCEVEIVPGSAAALEVALSQNDLQVMAEVWDGRNEILQKAIDADEVKIVGDTLSEGAYQGWYVPDYVVSEVEGQEPLAPNLKRADQLADYAALFHGHDSAERARFYNCPTGWVCETTNSALLKAHGLEGLYENFRVGTGAALDAAISSAFQRKEPILFYYWQPAGLMAKYNFVRLEQPPFDAACWDQIVEKKATTCLSDFRVSHLRIAVSTPFYTQHPDLVKLFEKYQLAPDLVNKAILTMTETGVSAKEVAENFIKDHPDIWKKWVPESVALALQPTAKNQLAPVQKTNLLFPDWSKANEINHYLTVLVKQSGDIFRSFSQSMLQYILAPLERVFMQTTPAAVLFFIFVISWHATRRLGSAFLYTFGFYCIGALGLWDKLMQTLALVVVSTLMSIVIGVPIGVLAARHKLVRKVVMPVLDMMQTMPSFVYLIPVLMLFGLGKVPAVIATVIYAVPPLIRLTSLGIRQVDRELVEAVQSFGVTKWQMLFYLHLPLARPSIMAGINQTTMMALSMVVVASMIGAQGLGEDVLAGIQTLDIGRGLQAGVAIVVLAIVIDRVTQAYGQSKRRKARSKEK